jgi:protocatechuate 3,4-dioxygenase beta subunit
MTMHSDHDDRHDFGLSYDLGELHRRNAIARTLRGFDRRDMLKFAFATTIVGATTFGLRRPAQSAAACVDIPEETGGPFPGDGTNGPNVLTTSGVVRRDITKSFGSMSGTAAGVPLTLTLTINNTATCAPAKGYAVYAWHCDQQGRYSLYSAGATDQNYLRGVQEADTSGNVTFSTIFPGCYDGRWPHIHFEVYPSLAAAGDASKRIATSQIAFPKAACDATYATAGYSASPANLAKVSLATDGVFSDDGGVRQLPTMTGSATSGFVAALTLSVSDTVKASGGGVGGPGGGPGQPPSGGGIGGPPPGAPGAPGAPGVTTPVTTVAPKTTIAKTTTAKKTTKKTVKRTTKKK